MCVICGQPKFIKCNCQQSVQPFCDQCTENDCGDGKIDLACTIYHLNNPQKPTKLNCLGLPNLVSGETIFEQIDKLICNNLNIPISSVDTPSIHWTLSGPANHKLQTDVKISEDLGNTLEIRPDGLFAMVSGSDILLVATDSNTIDFTTTGDEDHNLTASVKISSSAGNALSASGDGLYVPSYSSNNGITKDVTNNFQLGGTLIKNTTLDFAAAYDLFFTNTPLLCIGSNTPLSGGRQPLQVYNTIVGINAAIFTQNIQNISNSGGITGVSSFVNIRNSVPFTQTAGGPTEGVHGEIILDNSANLTLSSSSFFFNSGIAGIATKYSTGNVLGAIISGGYFGAFFSDSGNVQNFASIRAGTLQQAAAGANYSGTVTNYYGVYIDDSSSHIGTITNTFGIYQAGSSDLNVLKGDINYYGALTHISDARVKTDIEDYTKGLDVIRNIRPVEYNYIKEYDRGTGRKKVGIIAQELEVIIPEAISKIEEGNIKDFRVYEPETLIYILINSVKSLLDKVEKLETKNLN